MKKTFASSLTMALLLLVALSLANMPARPTVAATSQRAPRAPGGSKVMQYIASIAGSKTVAGQHNREPNAEPAKWTNAINATTGRYPGLWSGDFLFEQDNINNRWTMIEEAKRQWNQGALVNIMWHACPPTQGQACEWEGGIKSHLEDWQWNELLTAGTGLNNAWKARLDTIVPYLQNLKDNGVEVLWRPLHEMNQGVFWWGGRPGANGTRRLYQITRDYLTAKGLTNLIWVWDVQDLSWDFADYNPGPDYWDIAALDVYGGDGFTSQKYNAMLAVAGNKPIAIGETERLPTPAILAAQPRWVFFMAWAELVYSANSDQEIRTVYGDGRVITRDEMPGWNNPGVNLAYKRPATASSTDSAERPASAAVDADGNTRWSSAYSEPQWLRVDLGATYAVKRVLAKWETAYGRNYQIQLSNDGTNWTTVATVNSGDGGTDDLNGLSGTGRYVRLYGINRATQWGFSLWEFEIYGAAATSPTPPQPTATPRPTSVPPTATPRPTTVPPTSVPGAPAWQPNTAYAIGARVSYGGLVYGCRQAHTSQVGWEPPNTPALWLQQ